MPTARVEAHAVIIASPDIASREKYLTQLVGGTSLGLDELRNRANVIWLETDRSYGRDEVVKVVHELSLTSFMAETRWIIIPDARRLTPEAANALLKVVEEPPAGARFALLVDTVAHVMPTLRSRSQIIALPPQVISSHERAQHWLASRIPARLAEVAQLTDRSQQLVFYHELLEEARAEHNYDLAAWLMKYAGYAQGSGNVRLLLETCAVRMEEPA